MVRGHVKTRAVAAITFGDAMTAVRLAQADPDQYEGNVRDQYAWLSEMDPTLGEQAVEDSVKAIQLLGTKAPSLVGFDSLQPQHEARRGSRNTQWGRPPARGPPSRQRTASPVPASRPLSCVLMVR